MASVTEGRSIFDRKELVELATEIGLSREETESVLAMICLNKVFYKMKQTHMQ